MTSKSTAAALKKSEAQLNRLLKQRKQLLAQLAKNQDAMADSFHSVLNAADRAGDLDVLDGLAGLLDRTGTSLALMAAAGENGDWGKCVNKCSKIKNKAARVMCKAICALIYGIPR
jgi:hypothetical protein